MESYILQAKNFPGHFIHPYDLGLDNEMDQMSLEEALFALSADKSADTREGQTWHENLGDENLQCQVINGTTYFTPVNQNKTKER